MTLGEILDGKRVCICGGSGGVGKTTTSAAIAAGMAARGLRVAVVTIDPARRLATALGLAELGNEPRRIDGELFTAAGLPMRGELWAMMLDAKRTFDEVIERLAPDAATRDEVLGNRIYQQLSTAIAGSQEFTAIAKLYELDEEGDWDLLVLDTPPSRNALDFLDAPGRLMQFFQGRAIRVFLRPSGLIGRGTGVVFSILKRVTGVDLLEDLSVFFRDLGGMIDGFTDRARRVEALLADPATTFLIVTSPQHEPVEEAIYFHRKLSAARMPFGGVLVNRVHEAPAVDGDVPELADELGDKLAARVGISAREVAALAARDAQSIAHLRRSPGDPPTIVVPELDDDVHDVDGLARVREYLYDAAAKPR